MLLPRLVGDELKDRVFVDVACAGHFTLALTQNGEVVVWGKINDRVIPPTFIQFQEGRQCPIVQIKCGWAHAACVNSEGQMFVFGAGAFGRLGLGNNEDVMYYRPELCPASLKLKVDKVALGMSFSLVLLQNGELYACGDNSRGQLGIGKFGGMRSTPVKVDVLSQDRVVQVVAGADHSAAVTVNGRALTWGDNKYGTLGTGDRENCHTPTAVQALASLKIANIGCGSSHTIFITDSGKVYLCGGGSSLTDDMNQGSVITIPQELEGVQHITHAVAGVEHTILFAGAAKSSSPLGVDWRGAYNQPGGYADLRFTTAAATATGGDKTPFHAHRCVLASSAFFRGLIAERWTEDEADVGGGGSEVGERRVLEVELPAGVSGSFFERLLRSFYGGPQLTRPQLIAAQADLAALQQMAPTIATTFDATATTDDADDDAIDTAGDVVDDTAPTDESEPTTATKPTPRASWSRKLRAWLRGEAADHPPTETESLPQQQRHSRPQSPPPQDHQPLPPLVAWALACLLPCGGADADAGGEEQQKRPKKKTKSEEEEEEEAKGGEGAVTRTDPLEAHMRAMVDNPLFSDVAFVVGGRTIRAHKAVLALRCSYFEAMFSAGMRESGQREIDMDASDCTYAVFRRIIAYLYTNTLDPLDGDEKEGEESPLDDYVQLMNAAESFNLPHLKYLAEEQTIAGIDASNVAQLLDAAVVLRASSLAKSCFVFLVHHWKLLLRDQPDVVAQLDDATRQKIENHLRRTHRL